MDTFWTDFWNPGAIVRQILLMIVIPFLTLIFWRYWSYRSLKNIQQRMHIAPCGRTFGTSTPSSGTGSLRG
jgi:hypothetical protein